MHEHGRVDRGRGPGAFVQTDGGEVCSGNAFQFEGNAFNLGETPEWFWEVDEVWSTFLEDYGTITSDFDDFQYTFVNPGFASDTVDITLTVTRPNGCSATDQATLFVRPSYAPFVNDADGCSPWRWLPRPKWPLPSIGTSGTRPTQTPRAPPPTCTPNRARTP